MDIIYFHSDTFDFARAIYPGVGPAFAKPLGWRTGLISQLATANCDVAVVDHRLEQDDVNVLQAYFSKPAAKRVPVFIRICDPDMPRSDDPKVKFIFSCADIEGVHYAPTYSLAGPTLEFAKTLRRSGLAHLPFAYDPIREIDVPLEGREPKLFLSGAGSITLYPRRAKLRRMLLWNPWLRAKVAALKHPGYPEGGRELRHNITHDRFIKAAAQYTHFFLCGSRYNVELMKFVECAYAGSVPVGVPADTIRDAVGACFRPYRDRASDILADLLAPQHEWAERAKAYRVGLRLLRAPKRVEAEFKEQVAAVLNS